MNLTIEQAELPDDLALEDKWIVHKYNELVKAVTDNIDKYELGIAAQNCMTSSGIISVTGISKL